MNHDHPTFDQNLRGLKQAKAIFLSNKFGSLCIIKLKPRKTRAIQREGKGVLLEDYYP